MKHYLDICMLLTFTELMFIFGMAFPLHPFANKYMRKEYARQIVLIYLNIMVLMIFACSLKPTNFYYLLMCNIVLDLQNQSATVLTHFGGREPEKHDFGHSVKKFHVIFVLFFDSLIMNECNIDCILLEFLSRRY